MAFVKTVSLVNENVLCYYFYANGVDSVELKEVLDLFNSVVVEIDRLTGKVIEGYYENKFHLKEMSLSTLFKKIFLNYDNPVNANVFNSLKNWILETEGLINSTSIRYVSLQNVERTVYLQKNTTEKNIMLAFQFSKGIKNYPLMDGVTGLYQKNTFEQIVNAKIERNKKPFFFGVLDIDNFKHINDTYGYLHGDFVLRKVGSILLESFTDGYVARIGGDELAFICEDECGYQHVWERVKKVYDLFNGERLLSNNLEYTTFTMGISRFGIDAKSYEDLYSKANKALYRGKRKGKNCFIVYLSELHKDIKIEENSVNERITQNDALNFLANLVVVLNRPLDFEKNLTKSLIMIRDYFQVDYTALFNVIDGLDVVRLKTETAQIIYKESCLHELYQQHTIGDVVNIMRVYDLYRSNEKLYEFLHKRNKIISIMRVNIMQNDEVLGVLEFGTLNASRFFSVNEIELAKVIARIYASFKQKRSQN